jgi:hypothetical protein
MTSSTNSPSGFNPLPLILIIVFNLLSFLWLT